MYTVTCAKIWGIWSKTFKRSKEYVTVWATVSVWDLFIYGFSFFFCFFLFCVQMKAFCICQNHQESWRKSTEHCCPLPKIYYKWMFYAISRRICTKCLLEKKSGLPQWFMHAPQVLLSQRPAWLNPPFCFGPEFTAAAPSHWIFALQKPAEHILEREKEKKNVW